MSTINFDQKLLAQFIKAVAVIIIETIRHYEKNDEYANARYVYFEELIHTVICASKTLFMTNRGNKSGNVLTTELNCLVNFMYGWYVFIKTTGDTSLQSYLRYVRDKNFGDDKARYRDWETDRKSTRLNSSHLKLSRMPSSA